MSWQPVQRSSRRRRLRMNATVVPQQGPVGYLTLWPDGQGLPVVSTLNAYDGAVTSNMAIVPTTATAPSTPMPPAQPT